MSIGRTAREAQVFDDLTKPDAAYIVGLLQTDGHHHGDVEGKGKVCLELAARDAHVLEEIRVRLPCYGSVRFRTRTTNFRSEYRSATLSFFDQATRKELAAAGVPPGRKSDSIRPPSRTFVAADYFRGLLDGDGSVGFTARGMPFISMVTASPAIAEYVSAVILEVTGVRRNSKPNARDGVHNVMVANVAAARLAAWAWHEPHVIGIRRKREAALKVGAWCPEPARAARYGVTRRAWTDAEDEVVLNEPVDLAAEALGRTVKSVAMRRWRLSGDEI
ncbi:LAGLIDADG family homing endonuclease [Nocardioides humilatus]|uniref:LAGLIDADG family homing endonuclease n=1 Tax=Nocardioides humilatus TaxID=2607660 RepID=UPI00165F19B2|nr:LAGLIDADG family homing endonuclease [Nocardioides humilatus]